MNKLIYAHDAGPANILACNYHNNPGCLWYAKGPALQIFDNASSGNPLRPLDSFNQTDSVILGTSLIDTTHLAIISSCKQKNIYTSCCLEHWKNYLERFYSAQKDSFILPDCLLVYDTAAYRLAMSHEIFRRHCDIKLGVNNYKTSKINAIRHAYLRESSRERCPLFISEPASRFNASNAPDEHCSFNCLLLYLSRDDSFIPRRIVICMHPSDLHISSKVYTRIAESFDVSVDFCWSIEGVNFSEVSYVYGRDSMALELAAEAGIPTFTVFSKTSPFITLANPKLGHLDLL